MAHLANCRRCGKEISSQADACPHCGQLNPAAPCFIAVSLYGSYDCAEVNTLRRFRDDVLSRNPGGRLLVGSYYRVSPAAAKWVQDKPRVRKLLKASCDSFVKILSARRKSI